MKCAMFSPPKLTGKYLDKVLSSGWYTAGPMNDRLEEAVGEFWGVGKEHVLLTSSATAACWAVMDWLNYEHPGWARAEVEHATFPGIWMVDRVRPRIGRHRKPTQILTDIGGARFIDPPGYGPPCVLIHDIAHSWLLRQFTHYPNWIYGRPDYAFASFYPTKLVPGAEGGALYIYNSDEKEEIRWRINCGIVRGKGVDGGVRWGRPSHMGDVQAALNLEALENAPGYISAVGIEWYSLVEYAKHYNIPYRYQPRRPYLFQVETDKVAEVRARLKDFGWPTQHNFPPASLVTLPTNVNMNDSDRQLLMADCRRVLDGL